jgi:oligopeptide transport system substrate-binding protein
MKHKLFIVFIVPFLFFGCSKKTGGNKKIFKYNETTNIQSLDPAFAKNQSNMWAVHQLFNTLVEVDEQLNIKPSLAYKWDVSTDRKIVTFYLKPNILFHDNPSFVNGKGRAMTATDVVYSLGRLIDKNVASPGAWIFNGKVDTIQPFFALNDSMFQLKLINPFQPILGILSMQYCSIVPKEVVEKYGKDFRSHPCGTGPFQFEQWEEGQALTMIKNNKYFEKDSNGKRLPYLDGVKISFYDSKATEFLMFRQQKIHFINDIDASFKDEILNKKGELRSQWANKITLLKSPYLNTEYLGILFDEKNELLQNSPLKVKKIRQAINYAFDRRKMMLYIRNSIGTAAESGMVPSGLPSFDTAIVKGYSYNPEKAKQLLKEAGFENGRNLPEIKLSTIPIYADLGSYIAKELEQVGIKVQVDVMQKALLLEKTSKSQALFFRGSWIADYPDAENYLALFYSKNPAPPNYTRYKNLAYDALYEKAMLETNDSLRKKMYQQMDALMIEDAPVVPLWYDMVIHLVQPTVKGFKPNGLNLLELRKTEVE